MQREIPPSTRLIDFFRPMVHRSFRHLGLGDIEIADYVAAMLAEFGHCDHWLRLRDSEGRRLSNVVEILLEGQPLDTCERIVNERALRKYIGDYTLFMSGLFRDFIERGGYLSYYLEEGRRSYRIVSRFDASLHRPGYLIFEELSRGFDRYAGTLDYMRKCFFASESRTSPVRGFLRRIDSLHQAGRSNN